jgi:hypothetical protein
VSILDRLRLNAHLDDAALTALWADASLAGERPAHPHLSACAACRSRFGALTHWLGDVRSTAVAEADQAFPPERLAAQQAAIFRRLEASERPARVIRFPKLTRPTISTSSPVPRWIAASAAAGLVVGLGLGQMMDLRHGPERITLDSPARIIEPTAARPGPVVQAVATSSDAAFLAEIEATLTRPTVNELRAIDEFTPRAPFPDDRH